MYSVRMEVFLIILILFAAMALVILPLEWAAKAVGAKRTTWGWCLLALMSASIMQLIGWSVPVAGNVVAFLLSALAFAAILDTTYLRGVAVALLHIIFLAILVLLAAVMGFVSLAGLSMFGQG